MEDLELILEGDPVELKEGELRQAWVELLKPLPPKTTVPYFCAFHVPATGEYIAHAHALDVLPYLSPIMEFCMMAIINGGIDTKWASLYRDHYLNNERSRMPYAKELMQADTDFVDVVDVIVGRMKPVERFNSVAWIFVYQDGLTLKVHGSERISNMYPIMLFLKLTLSGALIDPIFAPSMIGLGKMHFPVPPAEAGGADPYDELIRFFQEWFK